MSSTGWSAQAKNEGTTMAGFRAQGRRGVRWLRREAIKRVPGSDARGQRVDEPVPEPVVISEPVASTEPAGGAPPTSGKPPTWIAVLRRAYWTSDHVLRLEGWALRRDEPDVDPGFETWLERSALDGTTETVPVRAAQRRADEVNAFVDDASCDRSGSGFTIEIDLNDVTAGVPVDEFEWKWHLVISRNGADGRLRGPLTERHRWGSPVLIPVRGNVHGLFVAPDWDAAHGLVLTVARRAATATAASATGRTVDLAVRTCGLTPTGVIAEESSSKQVVTGELTGDVSHTTSTIGIRLHLPDDASTDLVKVRVWYVFVTLPSGERRLVHWGLDELASSDWVQLPGTLRLCQGDRGALKCEETTTGILLDRFEFDAIAAVPTIHLSGRHRGLPDGLELWFAGARQQIDASAVELSANGTFSALLPLDVESRWTGRREIVGPGGFRLHARSGELQLSPVVAPAVTATLAEQHFSPVANVRLERTPDGAPYLDIAAPRAADEIGSYPKRVLAADAAAVKVVPGTVYIESFRSRLVSCNPLAVQAELSRRRPEFNITWGIASRAVPIPAGTASVVKGTRDWWETRGSAELVITNDWLDRGFERKPDQTVLQTWHGTPYKKLALDRSQDDGPNTVTSSFRRAVALEITRWEYLLAESPYMADKMRSAYGYEGQILTLGYPRNDVMLNDDGSGRALVRAQLGLQSNQTAVLYAPTWRENTTKLVKDLDLAHLATSLGPDYVVLLRGHMNVRSGFDAHADRLVDVTRHPDISALFLAADVLITDYSSVMFDFTASGKPVLFFVPDLVTYRDSLRGVYFDLAEIGPGPMLETTDQVINTLRDLDDVREAYSERYRSWQQQFNELDDGHAAERVVDALLATVDVKRGR